MKTLFTKLRDLGANTKIPEKGILLIVKGSFNDEDEIWKYWMFKPDDVELVIWLLKQYGNIGGDHWDDKVLPKKVSCIFGQYVPEIVDNCIGHYAHTINEFRAYAFENGECMEFDVVGCEMPDINAIYDKYYEWKDWQDEE